MIGARPPRSGVAVRSILVGLWLFGLLLTSAEASNTDQDQRDGDTTSTSRLAAAVHTLFLDHCAACHTKESNAFAGVRYRGELNFILDFDRLRDSDFVDLETPEQSELYLVIRDGEMPDARAVRDGMSRLLNAAESATVLAWIRAGAPAPADSLRRADREHADSDDAEALDDLPDIAELEELDPDLIDRGEGAFNDYCLQCHDAARSLDKTKDLAGWRTTVRRMASKSGAHIPSRELEPIAVYLTSLDRKEGDLGLGEDIKSELRSFIDNLDVSATFGTTFRQSARDDAVQNDGFQTELWIGAEWHATGPFTARITACYTCHRSNEPEGDRLELVEGAFRFDIDRALDLNEDGPQAAVDAGRFLVPFGGLGAQAHPAASRTVTMPLIYNMGQGVNRDDIGPAVIPMPYSDEGVLATFALPLVADVNATFDAYVVNGLQGVTDVNFFESRDYNDNNSDPSVGGRVTFGTPYLRAGASLISGRMDDDEFEKRLNYDIIGVDLTARYRNRVRVQAEWAKRSNDQFTFADGNPRGNTDVEGYSIEGDLLLIEDPGISLIARWDAIRNDGDIVPAGSSLTDPSFGVRRVTWGFRFALPFGSSLVLNHEHWTMPDDLDSVDLIGVRWIATF